MKINNASKRHHVKFLIHTINDLRDEDNNFSFESSECMDNQGNNYSKIVNSKKDSLRLAAARSRETEGEVLIRLACDENRYVRTALSENPSAPVEALRALLESNPNDTTIRKNVAMHPNADKEIYLALLSEDESWIVRGAVAMNHNSDYDVWNTVVGLTDERIKIAVAQRIDIPKSIMDKLSKDDADSVRAEIASQDNMHPEILMRLASDESSVVRLHVARNKSTAMQNLIRLSQDSELEVVIGVCDNPSATPELLEKISLNSKDSRVLTAVASNESTPLDVLKRLLETGHVGIQQSVAANRNASPELLEDLAFGEYHQIVQHSAKLNPNSPQWVKDYHSLNAEYIEIDEYWNLDYR